MKFRVERDVLADAVAWAARSLPVRPRAPVLAGLLIEAADDGLVPRTFDYETSARATLTADVAEGRRWSAAGCSPTSAAACPTGRSRWSSRAPRSRSPAVRPASACRRCRSTTTRPCPRCPGHRHRVDSDDFAHAVAQGGHAAGRDDMLPVLTGVRIEIDGDTIALLATDRFRLSQRELAGTPPPPTSAAALVPAKVLADTAKSLGASGTIARARRHRRGRGHHRLRGRGGGAPHHDPAARRRVPQGPHAVPERAEHRRRVDKAALVESVKRVALVAERNTAVQLRSATAGLTLDAGSGDEAQATEPIEAPVNGEDITTGFNPQFLLDGLTASSAVVVHRVHPGLEARGDVGAPTRTARPTRRSATC